MDRRCFSLQLCVVRLVLNTSHHCVTITNVVLSHKDTMSYVAEHTKLALVQNYVFTVTKYTKQVMHHTHATLADYPAIFEHLIQNKVS
jgi:hypothetical protein